MSKLEQDFCIALSEHNMLVKTHGTRSSAKLYPSHAWLANTIGKDISPRFECHYLAEGKTEITVEGLLNKKKVDIAFMLDKQPYLVCGFKFVSSNYNQNANNYLESLTGEVANLKPLGIQVGAVMVVPYDCPYYDKAGNVKRIEKIASHQVEKYARLAENKDLDFSPQMLCYFLVDLLSDGSVRPTELDSVELEPSVRSALRHELSLDRFVESANNSLK